MKNIILAIALIFVSISAQAKNTTINIKSSLYADSKKQGLSFSTINTVTKALGWKLNFNTLRKNDKFVIIGSHKKKPDAIIYKRGKKRIKVFLWRGKYYDKNGKSLGGGFLKAPLKYKRISSKFQYKRYHPILKTYLPHRAVDYAANKGTKVRATADGIVKKRRHIGALGNAIFIKHGANYQTVYAHLSRFARKLKVGRRVKKGQVIGYVGSTGRSTGPHLHYEVRYKGKRKNPLTYKLPKQGRVSKKDLANFKRKVSKILAKL